MASPAVVRSCDMRRSTDKQADAIHIEPLTVRISTAVQLTGISRSRLYELIQSGDLETVKVGRSTLIPYKSLKALTRG
mgnify:CR=1 FL=1